MAEIKSIGVFCGSSLGCEAAYTEQARKLGEALARQNISLVFGGSNIGLMGVVAGAVMDNSGYAIGVIPRLIHAMVSHRPLSEEYIVEDMHERKALMYSLADAFIILPGGLGTMEEFLEAFTWNQLGYHLKPIGILDINNFFTPLLKFLQHMVAQGFCRQEQLDTLVIDTHPGRLLEKLGRVELKPTPKHSRK